MDGINEETMNVIKVKVIRSEIANAKTKKKTTPKTPANPSSSSVQDKDISLERLATMDVRSPEYAELRKQLGLH